MVDGIDQTYFPPHARVSFIETMPLGSCKLNVYRIFDVHPRIYLVLDIEKIR